MIDKLQYDSFYKFLVSIGLVLFLSPLFGLYYFVSGSYDIMISQTDLNNLSSISSTLINIKADFIKKTYQLFPCACLILVVIGLIFIFIGCKEWYNIQKTLDKLTELDLKEKQLNIQKMTPTEIVKKVLKEDEDDICDENLNVKPAYSTSASRIKKAFEIEDLCYKYLRKKLGGKYVVHQNVRINRFEYDIVATSIHDNIDFIYEIKYWSGPVTKSALYNLFKSIEQRGIEYENTTQRSFKFIILIVSTSDGLVGLKKQFSEQFTNILPSFAQLEFFNETDLSIY